jgi:hypothetical protein
MDGNNLNLEQIELLFGIAEEELYIENFLHENDLYYQDTQYCDRAL